MGKQKDLSLFNKGKIVALHLEGKSQVAISKILNVSRAAVQNAIKFGASKNRKNCGRRRKTTPREDRVLRRVIVSSPHTSSLRVAEIARSHSINISARTVRRRLCQDFNLVARRPARKPAITRQQRLARIRFCKQHKDKSAQWWRRVMFSDESTFRQVRGIGFNYVRRPAGLRFHSKYTTKTIKQAPHVMVWGAITSRGRCGLHIFEKGQTVNAKQYVEVINSKVKVHMNITKTTLFQQDSAPCHTAAITKKWFEKNGVQLLLNWPSNSPDLNVIENCWNLMKRKVSAHKPTSEAQLRNIIKEVWVKEISVDYCKKLIDSMPQRIKAVLENHGYPTRY